MRRNWASGLLASIAVVVVAGGGASLAFSSCAATPINVPLRTFARAQKVDVVCLQVGVPDPNNPGGAFLPITAEPQVQSQCAPVPPNTDPGTIPFHLYALVTQTQRGELAVVDLSGGYVVDEDRVTPGANFIPVGANPTDVAVAPDGVLTFVSAAEPNKPAIYAVPNVRILGDSQPLPPATVVPPLTLSDLAACTLPQPPGSLAIVPYAAPATMAGGDAGAPAPAYKVFVVLRASGGQTAKVVTIDPTGFLPGASPPIAPGTLAPCPITSAIELSASLPVGWTPGPKWSDGVTYVDGGVDLGDALPAPSGTACSADAGDAGPLPLSFGPTDPPRPTASALALNTNHPTLYISDNALPVIHVIDLTNPDAPVELAPLLATSEADPSRQVSVGALATSPVTHDLNRYLYAVDQKDGTIIPYDITDPVASPRVPLRRPHPELNPFQPPDRIGFNAPVATVAFVRHDWPLTTINNAQVTGAAPTGLICNPNPNAITNLQAPIGTAVDTSEQGLGAYYRNDFPGQQVPLGPLRLRGIFAFVTLSNGQVVTVDVDDWDAPCRRPDPVDGPNQISSLAVPEPAASGPTDLDPYHVPIAYAPIQGNDSTPVSLETFFPVSAPHRVRSNFPLGNFPNTGVNLPAMIGLPQLFDTNNSSLAVSGLGADQNPSMLPTFTTFLDPTYIVAPLEPNPNPGNTAPEPPRLMGTANDIFSPSGDPQFSLPHSAASPAVRFSWEEPDVHFNQDWSVTFEGSLPNFSGLPMVVKTTDDYESITIANPNALLCRRGVEDLAIGQQRVAAENAALAGLSMPTLPTGATQWTGDYVQIADDLLGSNDPYWSDVAPGGGSTCWDPPLADPANAIGRYNACLATFGTAEQVPELFVQRDFPILEAYDDHMVLGRFGYPDPSVLTTTSRVIVGPDPSNRGAMRLMQCCFHQEITFNVRTGNSWLTVGTNVGYLHHITVEPTTKRCVQSCDPAKSLLNARASDNPRPTGATRAPDRDSALSMRNPSFSFVMWSGVAPTAPDHTTSTRDLIWKFSTNGQFTPQVLNIATTSQAVSPQSMLFIDSLGQLAVVDGSDQGLVLIDLNTIAEAHTPFF